MRVVVTGATGCVGFPLSAALAGAGHRVTALVHDADGDRARRLAGTDGVEVVVGDLLAPETLPSAVEGADAGYYLVHSLGTGADYAARDRRAARNFADAADRAGLDRVVYLGGLGPDGAAPTPGLGGDGQGAPEADGDDGVDAGRSESGSGPGPKAPAGGPGPATRDPGPPGTDPGPAPPGAGGGLRGHLRSRRRVEGILGAGRYDHRLLALRAAVVVGPDSGSFRMVRRAVRRLPVLPAPPAIRTTCQPIALGDTVRYLRAALELPASADGRVYEVGGPDRLTYAAMLRRTADRLGTRTRVVPVPGLSLSLAARALSAVTGVERGLVDPLVESLPVPAVVTDRSVREHCGVELTGFEAAVDRAIADAGTGVGTDTATGTASESAGAGRRAGAGVDGAGPGGGVGGDRRPDDGAPTPAADLDPDGA